VRKMLKVQGATLFLFVLGLLGAGSVAVAAGDAAPARILVTGEGSANVAPDMAIIVMSVSRDAPTAREALSANSHAMNKVLEAMTKLGIAKRDLQTSNFDIQPRYTYPQPTSGADQTPRLVGYTVRNTLTVTVRDIARVGEILDTSVTLGVNEGGSIQFGNDDPTATLTQARIKAVENGMAKARTLAEAAGVKTGKVLEISEQNYTPQPVPIARMKMEMAAADAAVPIAAGENSYKVTVNVTLSIEQ
jgi:uncharacterized protein